MGRLFDQARESPAARFIAKYNADRADEGAVVIAWTAMFSLFPLIVGLLAILGLLLRNAGLSQALANAILTQFPSEFSDLLVFLQETREISGLLGIASILGLLWSGSALFGAMAQVFNRFYGVPDRGFIAQRLMAFGMIFVYVVLILVTVLSAGLPTLLISISETLPFRVPGTALAISWAVSLGTAVTMFLALYRVVPNARLHVRQIWRGAVLGGVLFVVLNQVFPFYLQFFGAGFHAYATLGLLLLLMTWFYLLARIIVLGAELNAFLAPVAAPDRAKAADAEARCPTAGRESRAECEPSPAKVMLWAGLTAGVTGLVLALSQRLAAAVWQALTGERPPCDRRR